MMMKQKEAVFQAVTNVCGEQDGAYSPTKEERASINQILFEGIRQGKIECGTEYDDSDLKQYVGGLQSNWLRKDTRLNGGVKYQPKNPGSRAGSADPQVKAMRILLSTVTNPEDKAHIQATLDARLAAIKPAKSGVTLTDEQKALLEANGLGEFVKS